MVFAVQLEYHANGCEDGLAAGGAGRPCQSPDLLAGPSPSGKVSVEEKKNTALRWRTRVPHSRDWPVNFGNSETDPLCAHSVLEGWVPSAFAGLSQLNVLGCGMTRRSSVPTARECRSSDQACFGVRRLDGGMPSPRRDCRRLWYAGRGSVPRKADVRFLAIGERGGSCLSQESI